MKQNAVRLESKSAEAEKILTEAERELYPSRNKNATKVTMGDDHDVTPPLSLFEKLPVNFLHLSQELSGDSLCHRGHRGQDLVYNSVHPFGHLLSAFTARTAIMNQKTGEEGRFHHSPCPPNGPVSVSLLNLGRF